MNADRTVLTDAMWARTETMLPGKAADPSASRAVTTVSTGAGWLVAARFRSSQCRCLGQSRLLRDKRLDPPDSSCIRRCEIKQAAQSGLQPKVATTRHGPLHRRSAHAREMR